MKTLNEAINEAKTQLSEMIEKLHSFEFPKAITIQFETSCINVDEIVKEVPTGSSEEDYIYFLKVVGKVNTNTELFNLLENEKNTHIEEKKKDLPRINTDHKGTQYLYVGRSQKLRTRLRQHLGSNYVGTYGLHMQRWAQGINEKIEIQYYKLDQQDNLLVQAVEDSLWLKLKPAFGRKGDK